MAAALLGFRLLGPAARTKLIVDSQSIFRCEASFEIAMETAAKGEGLHGVLHHQGKTLVANCVPEQISMCCIYNVFCPPPSFIQAAAYLPKGIAFT